MAVTASAIIAERWLDEVLITGTIPNVLGGTFFLESFTSPPGVGDLAIMEVGATAFALATINPAAKLGSWLDIRSADGATVVDILGTAEWLTVTSDEMRAYWSPDPLVLWRQNEIITITGPELDTNASPTGDLRLFVKAVRVRPVEGAPGPIQLVR